MRELKDFLAKGILNKILFIVLGLILLIVLFYVGCFVAGMTLFAETSFGARKKTYSNGTIFDTYQIIGNWARTPSGWVCLDYATLLYAY